MASAVEFPPVPAMMGTRPAAWVTAVSTSRQCSSTLTVGDSPVVPTATMPCVPCSICQSIRCLYASRSRAPSSLMGVAMATRLPVSIVVSLGFGTKAAFYSNRGAIQRRGRHGKPHRSPYKTAVDERHRLSARKARRGNALQDARVVTDRPPFLERKHRQAATSHVEKLAGREQEVGVP